MYLYRHTLIHAYIYPPPCRLQGTSGVFLVMGKLPFLQPWIVLLREDRGSSRGLPGVLHDFWPLNFYCYFLLPELSPTAPKTTQRGSNWEQFGDVLELQVEI